MTSPAEVLKDVGSIQSPLAETSAPGLRKQARRDAPFWFYLVWSVGGSYVFTFLFNIAFVKAMAVDAAINAGVATGLFFSGITTLGALIGLFRTAGKDDPKSSPPVCGQPDQTRAGPQSNRENP
jgi:hypothetical protein